MDVRNLIRQENLTTGILLSDFLFSCRKIFLSIPTVCFPQTG